MNRLFLFKALTDKRELARIFTEHTFNGTEIFPPLKNVMYSSLTRNKITKVRSEKKEGRKKQTPESLFNVYFIYSHYGSQCFYLVT